jgi:predicted Zn-dependent protease
MRGLVSLAAAAALLAGCSANPVTGRSQFMVVSERQAIGESAAAYNNMMGQLGKKKQIEAGTARAEKVRDITDKLIAQAVRFRPETASWNWQVELINDPKTVNAFCMAGGKMAIYTGFFEQLKATDDEIAQVMGHEIGHALANHTQERMSRAMALGVGTSLAAIVLSSRTDSATAQLGLTAAQVAVMLSLELPNSRQGESEADQIGIELAARAGYDPNAAVTLWEKMGRLSAGKAPPQFMSTHPSAETRAARLRELIPQVQPYYVAAKANPPLAPRFLAAKDAGANERSLTRAGEPTREEYARRMAAEGETMTFLAEPYQRFRRGEAMLDCRAACAAKYGQKKGEWKKLHAEGRWRPLVNSVLDVAYGNDLAYFMLGEAARGLNLGPQVAGTYFKRALDAPKELSCGTGCEGFDVQKQARTALQ